MTPIGHRRSSWHRLRLQLGGCLLVAAILPFLARALWLDSAEDFLPLQQAFIGSALAIIAGTWLWRNVTTYPGVEASAYILPVLSLSYFVLLVAFLLTRLEYSRQMLFVSYLFSLGWFFLVHAMMLRSQHLSIAYLPYGEVGRLADVPGVTWTPLDGPDADVSRFQAIAADLRVDLPTEWDRRLADFALAGMPVYHVSHLVESLTGRVELEHLSENSFGSLAPVGAYMTIKHLVDWVMALVVGTLLLPFLLLVAIAIRMTSPGPALFSQQRIGYRGKPFTVYKFRTMTVAHRNPSEREAAITRVGDDRITRLGKFLRTSRIDELPQIINVLRGEMSWIGPRPEAEVLSRWYEAEIPFYRYRHIVRPGIAGWAQVQQGHVAEVADVRSKLHYDFYYIKHYSPWIDMLIVVRTIRTMLTGYGAR